MSNARPTQSGRLTPESQAQIEAAAEALMGLANGRHVVVLTAPSHVVSQTATVLKRALQSRSPSASAAVSFCPLASLDNPRRRHPEVGFAPDIDGVQRDIAECLATSGHSEQNTLVVLLTQFQQARALVARTVASGPFPVCTPVSTDVLGRREASGPQLT